MGNQISDAIRIKNGRAREAAQLAMESLQVEATDLVEFYSQGRVVVIGGADALEIAPRLVAPLKVQVLLTEGEELPGVPVISQAGRQLQISGHLGAFKLQLGEPGKPNAETLAADLILDLGAEPQLQMAMKPPGYLVATIEEESISQVIPQLSELVGTFDKPRYFSYDAAICAHGRSGQIACTRCIDACPAEAISSLIDKVAVDANLCQGGGACATVCPSGAIRYSYPSAQDTLNRVRVLLKSYREAGGTEPILVFSAETDGEPAVLPENYLLMQLEELASVGLEVWLSALAYGAVSVILLERGGMPAQVAQPVRQQIDTAGEILAALGYPASAVRLVDEDALGVEAGEIMTTLEPANFSTRGGKRQIAYMAIDHLFEQAARPKPLANLSVGAPFGTAHVEANACTLCFACVGVCPGKALMPGQDQPQLRFVEANCLQCGMCTRACPEDAIWITPRLLFDREARAKTRLLHEEPPFCCTECGKPFATRSVIDTMLGKLEGHWMFQDERAKRRLRMCQDCRVVDIAQDPAAMDQGMLGERLQ